MSPRRLALSLLPAALLAAALAAVPADARTPRPRCNLAGPDLAPSRTIDVAQRRYEDGTRLVGCVRPYGRVRTIVDAPDMGLGQGVARLSRVAGTWVVASASASNQYGYGSSLRVVDVRSGRAYELFSQGATHGEPPPSPQLAAYEINPRGWAAVVLDDLDPQRRPNENPAVAARRVVLHDPLGRARQLALTFAPAAIDPASLVLDHHTVLWTQDGAVHYRRF